MGARAAAPHPWWARTRRRAGLLALAAAVVAVPSGAALLLVTVGPVAARAASGGLEGAPTVVAVAVSLDGLAVALLAVLTGVTLVVIARRTAVLRAAEDALLVSRGATRWQLGRWGAAEGSIAGAVGVLVGTAVARTATTVTGTGAGPLGDALVPAGLIAVVGVLGSAAASALAVRRAPGDPGASGRVATAAVLVAAAAFSTWRLSSGPLPIGADGTRVRVDVVAAAAPVLWVVAGAAVVVLCGGLAARLAARAARTSRGFLPAYTVRRTARSWATTAPTVLTAAVVVATGVFVAGFAATVSAVDDGTARAVVGTDVRVRLDGDRQVDARSALPDLGLDDRRGVTETPVWTDTADLGTVEAQLVGVPGTRAAEVLPGAAGAAVARTRATGRAGVAVDPRASTISVLARTGPAELDGTARTDAVGSVGFAAWVVDRRGVPALVPLSSGTGDGSVPVGATARLEGSLPAVGSGWRLLAVEPSLSFSSRPPETDQVGADALTVPVRVTVDGPDGVVSGTATAVDLAAPVRVVLGQRAGDDPVPVVLSRALADRLDVRTGSALDLTPSATSTPLRVTVAAVVPSVPGAAARSAVAVDLDRVVAASVDGGAAPDGSPVPRVDERWIVTPTPGTVAERLRERLGDTATVTTADTVRAGPVVGTAVAGLTATAALGVLLTALVVATGAAGADGSRRSLRAAGVPARASAVARGTALAAVTVLGVLGGTVVGLVAVAVTVAPLALSAVPTAGGLVEAVPVLTSSGTWVAPGALVLVAAVVSGAVVLRDRRREERP